MSKPKNEHKKTIRIIDDDDCVIETTESGLPGTINPQTEDIEEELHSMQGYKDYIRNEHSDNLGINFGDY